MTSQREWPFVYSTSYVPPIPYEIPARIFQTSPNIHYLVFTSGYDVQSDLVVISRTSHPIDVDNIDVDETLVVPPIVQPKETTMTTDEWVALVSIYIILSIIIVWYYHTK